MSGAGATRGRGSRDGAGGARGIEALRAKLDAIEPGAVVRSIRPSKRDAGRCTISVGAPGRRAVGIAIDALAGERLRIAPGDEWTDDLARRVREAVELDRARRDAMGSLSRAPMSRGRLLRKLRDRGYAGDVADAVADDLERIGLLDDRELAAAAARSLVSRRPAGARFIEMKLREKGFDAALARDVAADVLGERDPAEDALALAQKKAAAMPASLERDARRRRIYGMLARRGFSPEVCRATVDRLASEADPCP